MKMIQLGNAGGLNSEDVSSSFLFEKDGKYLLIDCGYNVIKKLKKLDIDLRNLETVYITHIHEDHIANLLLLVYTRMFLYQSKTTIIPGNSQVYDFIKNYFDKVASQIYIGSVLEPHRMFQLEGTNITGTAFKIPNMTDLWGSPIDSNHIIAESTGIILRDNCKSHIVAITGDTKAHPDIEYQIVKALEKFDTSFNCTEGVHDPKCIIFHDFSHFNQPSRNPHACISDITSEYTPYFRKSLNFYHDDNKKFYKHWVDLGDEYSVKKSKYKLFDLTEYKSE